MFHEFPSHDLWSARIPLAQGKDAFGVLLRETAEREGFTFFGFFVFDGVNDEPIAYHFTRYPRIKYGIRTVEECQRVLGQLEKNFEEKGITVAMSVENREAYYPYQYRIILGLREGYDHNKNIPHSLEEAKIFLGDGYLLRPAEMFAVGPARMYTEPALMILGRENKLPRIYELALQFQQERFIVEDFVEGTSYEVETIYGDLK